MKEVQVPDSIRRSKDALEVLRVWAEPGKPQNFAVNGPVWKEPAAWGLLLADVARFISSVYAAEDGSDKDAVLRRIKDAWTAELG